MDNKEKISGSQNNGGRDAKAGDQSLDPVAKIGIPATQRVKTKRRKKKSIRKEVWVALKAIRPEVWVAIITATATIITTIVITLPNLLPFVPLIQPTPTPTFTLTASPTLLIPATPTVSITDTLIPVITPSTTYTPTASMTSTEIPITVTPSARMEVYLFADKTTGKVPLKVKLDARDSYLREPNGTKFPCRGGPCNYTWKVYSNGTQLGKAVTDSGGTFEYSFGKKGVYMVTVYICRGRDRIDCGGSGSQIVVN